MTISKVVRNLDAQLGQDKFLFFDFLVGTEYELRIPDDLKVQRGTETWRNRETVRYKIDDIQFNPTIRIKSRGDDTNSMTMPFYYWWSQLAPHKRNEFIRLFRNIQRGQIPGVPLPIFTQKKSRRKWKSRKKSRKKSNKKYRA